MWQVPRTLTPPLTPNPNPYLGEFLDKNNDTLNADFETALLASNKPLIVEVCAPTLTLHAVVVARVMATLTMAMALLTPAYS